MYVLNDPLFFALHFQSLKSTTHFTKRGEFKKLGGLEKEGGKLIIIKPPKMTGPLENLEQKIRCVQQKSSLTKYTFRQSG